MKRLLLPLLLVLVAGPALGHARLVQSAPTAGARIKSPDKLVLTFSESLEPAFSGAQLTDGADKPVVASVAVGGAAITLIPPPALKPGTYHVRWHSVGQDTHRLEGSFQFTVLP